MQVGKNYQDKKTKNISECVYVSPESNFNRIAVLRSDESHDFTVIRTCWDYYEELAETTVRTYRVCFDTKIKHIFVVNDCSMLGAHTSVIGTIQLSYDEARKLFMVGSW